MYAGVMAKEIDVFGFYFGENTIIDFIALFSLSGCGCSTYLCCYVV